MILVRNGDLLGYGMYRSKNFIIDSTLSVKAVAKKWKCSLTSNGKRCVFHTKASNMDSVNWGRFLVDQSDFIRDHCEKDVYRTSKFPNYCVAHYFQSIEDALLFDMHFPRQHIYDGV
ncbi:MAG: hypothetical protein WC284_10870 [Candidimonas sp.]